MHSQEKSWSALHLVSIFGYDPIYYRQKQNVFVQLSGIHNNQDLYVYFYLSQENVLSLNVVLHKIINICCFLIL